MTEAMASLRNEVETLFLQIQRIAGTEADRIDEAEGQLDTFHAGITAMALQAIATKIQDLVGD